jgi:uncharacterized membrane protein
MFLLILGLVLFFSSHGLTMARGLRASLIGTIGAGPYKGLYSLVAGTGLVLIIWGFGDYRNEGLSPLWTPIPGLRHLTHLLVLLAFILLVATYAPRGRIKALVKHPMLAAVTLWSLGHLLANGDLGGFLLFGSFLAFSILDRIAVELRPDGGITAPVTFIGDVIAVIGGVIAFGAMAMLHPLLIGVPIFP